MIPAWQDSDQSEKYSGPPEKSGAKFCSGGETMTVHILVESIIIPKSDKDHSLILEQGATAEDAVRKMEEKGLTGNLTAEKLLATHILICNSEHIRPDTKLKDGDTLMIIKTLLGG